jgi:N-acetyl-1-D-myo-inositol-2-amino-2-deoxy-alpha-D-glucopyranoside deacetylase
MEAMISAHGKDRCMAFGGLVFVHAHPDDETLLTGGTIARYANEGTDVCLITCTDGEEGEVADVPELGTHDEIKAQLGVIRRDELTEACRRLGPVDLRMLGYHDSGMDGTPENEAAHAFINQPLAGVVEKVVRIIEEVRPRAVVTYNEVGGYGHPDHIHAHRAAMEAASWCGVAKVYHAVYPRSLMRAGREMFGDNFFTEEEIERIGTPDELITTRIDVARYIDHKFAALEAHRTQLGTTKPFLDMPQDVRELGMGTEHFVLVGADGVAETDLLA